MNYDRRLPTTSTLFVDVRDRQRAFDAGKQGRVGDSSDSFEFSDYVVCLTSTNVSPSDPAGTYVAPSAGLPAYRNVTSVELMAVSFPKILGEEWVCLSIEELDDNLDSIDGGSNGKFAIIYFDNVPTGVAKPLKGRDFIQKVVTFDPPLSSLDKLTIRFLKHGNLPVTRADLAPLGTTNFSGISGNNSMILKIEHLSGWRSAI